MFALITEKIETLKKQVLVKVSAEQAMLYVCPLAIYTNKPGEALFDLTEAVQQFFKGEISANKEIAEVKESKACGLQKIAPQVLLLLGDNGCGKTRFCQDLVVHLWKTYQPGQAIPLLINLANLTNPFEQAIEDTLLQNGFTKEEITVLKRDYSFNFIFDGYDELYAFKNLYVGNELNKWHAKVVITCRIQYLYNTPHTERYFTPYRHQKPQRQLLLSYAISPLSPAQITTYIQQYEAKDPQPLSLLARYQVLVSGLALKSLITNPLLFHLTLKFLSTEADLTELKSEDQKKIIQANYYDFILDQWFHYHLEKFKANKRLADKVPTMVDCWGYCKSLAQVMTEQKVNFLAREELLGQAAATSIESQVDPWEPFFRRELLSVVIRSSCPFVRLAANQYGFMETSFIQYFANKPLKIVSPLSKPMLPQAETKEEERVTKYKALFFDLQNPFCQMSYVRVPDRINFFADRLRAKNQEAKTFTQADLFQLIEMSKEDERYAVGAANAISVLNQARVSFSGKNLSRIRIPGANLTSAILDCADLQEADLNKANLQNAWLRQANLKNAKMKNVRFYEYPFLKFSNQVLACGYAPDGRWLAVGHQKQILVYKAASQVLKYIFQGDANFVTSISFSPNSRQIVCGIGDTIYLWEFVSGNSQKFIGHEVMIWSVAFSPDGKSIASAGIDQTVRLWEIDSAKCRIFSGHMGVVNSVAFSPNGSHLVSGGADHTLRLWEIASGNSQIFKGDMVIVSSVAFSPDGRHIASGSWDTNIRLWEVASGSNRIFAGHTGNVFSVAFSPNGQYIASGSSDNTIRLWEIVSGEAQIFAYHTALIRGVTFSPDSRHIFSVSDDCTAYLREVNKGGRRTTSSGHIDCVWSLAFNSGGHQVVSGSLDKTVRLWDSRNGSSRIFFEHTDIIRSVAFSPDDRYIASGGDDNIIYLSEVSSGRSQNLVGPTERIFSIAFSPDGHQIASGSGDKMIRLWTLENISAGYRIFSGHTSVVFSVAFSHDGRQLLSGSADHTIRLWDIATGSHREFSGHTGMVFSAAFSPDDKSIVSGASDHTIRLWNIATGDSREFIGHTGDVLSVIFIDDDKVASASYDQTVRLWEIATRQCLYTVRGFIGAVYNIKWIATPADSFLVTASLEGAVRYWQLKEDHSVHLLWSSHSGVLIAEDACLNGVQGLSRKNFRLLHQRGAKGAALDFKSSTQDSISQAALVTQHHVIFTAPDLSKEPKLASVPKQGTSLKALSLR